MSKITIELKRTDVSQKGNHFLVIQLDETEYPSGLKKTQKFRTEIEYDTESPQFLKTYFEFRRVTLGNRLVLRIGLFNTKISKNLNESEIASNYLFQHSKLIGANDIIFTSTLMNILSKHKWIENDIRLMDPEKDNKETGHVYIKLTIKSESIDAKVYENNKEIEECYCDPFETDQEKIREKLRKVIILNEEKQIKLGKKTKELERINNTLKALALDKTKVLNEVKVFEEENNHLRKNLHKMQNYDEIHIEVDILSQSSQGVQIIEKKYAIILSQLALQNQYHLYHEREYEEIDSLLSKIKIIKDKINQIKQANHELKFNITRQQDQLPLITTYEERIKNNDKLISNLRENINEVIKKNEYELKKKNHNLKDCSEIEEKIMSLYKERKVLEEKTSQMKLFSGLYGHSKIEEELPVREKTDSIPENSFKEDSAAYNNFLKITGSGLDPLMNKIVKDGEVFLLKNYQDTISKLSSEVDDMTKILGKVNLIEKEQKENEIIIDPNIKIKKMQLLSKIKAFGSRETALLEELESSQMYFKHSIGRMIQRIEDLDKIIARSYNNYNHDR